MASGNDPNALFKQPKFADAIRRLPNPLGVSVPLQRGYMIWAGKNFLGYTGGELGDGRDIIHFLFNPSTVTADYNMANSGLQSGLVFQNVGDSGTPLIPMMQTVQWDLYFDRTYELNYGGNGSGINDPAVIGVQADIMQFMQFTGVLKRMTMGQLSAIGTGTGTWADAGATAAAAAASALTPGQAPQPQSLTSGMMTLIPCYVFFGNALKQMNDNSSNSNFNTLHSELSYYGYISQWSVNYTHWTGNMVPIRAVVSVGFTMLPDQDPAQISAIWNDAAKLGRAPYNVPAPTMPGYKPYQPIFNKPGA